MNLDQFTGIYRQFAGRMKTTRHYEVVVRLESGGSQTITYAAQPGFAGGARVKVENGTLAVVQ